MKILDLNQPSGILGQPLDTGSANFIQLAYQETITALSAALIGQSTGATDRYGAGTYNVSNPAISLGNPVAISGGVINAVGGGMWQTNGMILWNGLVYLINDVPFVYSGSGNLYAHFNVNNSESFNGVALDPLAFTDGSFRNVHNDTTITFNTTAAGAIFNYTSLFQMVPIPTQISNAIATAEATTISTQIANAIFNLKPAFWTNVTSFGVGWAGALTDVPRFCQDGLGNVHFQGAIKATSNSLDTVFTVLPPAYRPSQTISFVLSFFQNSGSVWKSINVVVNTNGNVQQVSGTPTTNDYIDLAGIQYTVVI